MIREPEIFSLLLLRLESSSPRCTLDDKLREWPELGGSSFEPCPDDQRFARYRLHPARDTGSEEALPVRRRATAAETRLTPGEWGLLSILTLMQFSVTIDFIIIAPLGPQLMRVFGIDTAQFGWTVAAYAFGAGLSSFSAAFFLDRFDRKRALLVLFTGFTVGTFCCALAPGYHAMLAARFMTGIFGGVCGGVVLAIVGDAIPEIRRATAMGTVMSAFALASALGVPAGLWMAERGWHWPFLILGILCAAIIPFAIWLLPRSDTHLRQAASTESAGARMWAILANGKHLRAFSLMAGLTTAGFMVVPFISTFMVRNVGMTESQLKYIFLRWRSLHPVFHEPDRPPRGHVRTHAALHDHGDPFVGCHVMADASQLRAGPAHCRGDQRVHGHDDGAVRPRPLR